MSQVRRPVASRPRRAVASVLLALLLGPAQAWAAGSIAFDLPALQAPSTLQIAIPAVKPGGVLPANYTVDGRNLSPAISWSAGPPSTRSYVLVLQDPDAHTPESAVHWLVYALPPGIVSLPRGLHNVADPSHPLGSAQGRNYHDTFGYSGPHPPVGDPPHHYHFQVFALDRAVRVRPGADFTAVERAMEGHVVARGELVATYVAPVPGASAKGRAARDAAAASPAVDPTVQPP